MRRNLLRLVGRTTSADGASAAADAPAGLDDAWRSRLADAEHEVAAHPDRALCATFAHWTVADFGRLLLADLTSYPSLVARLPRMPSEEIQRRYTWWHGEELMRQSVEFTEALRRLYESWTERPLHDARVLDYGAGWGRLTRMLLQFVPEDRIRACDAWRPAVDIFDGLGFGLACDLVDPVPAALPYPPESIDLAWLFSVLTHLPADAAEAVMTALSRVVAPGGVVIATIRPEGFWSSNPLVTERGASEEMIQAHRRDGFAHLPHPSAPVWGDSSMTVEYAAEHFRPWQVVTTENSASHQARLVLRRPPGDA
jgi:SAM-dependent methyltransferase